MASANRVAILVLAVVAWPSAARAQAADRPPAVRAAHADSNAPDAYAIGPRDVLGVTVWSQMDLSGKYPVDADGTFTFPLLGAVKVEGLTPLQVAAELRERLKEGFFRDPQLTVSVDDYRSQRVFVMGQVRQPGSYPLSGGMTVIEALARAGSTTPDAAAEALIVRPAGAGRPSEAAVAERAAASDVTRVNLNDLQSGVIASTLSLHDGDTIFVPRAETIFVSGYVRSPGAYPIGRATTVLQALALAGGLTARGASTRIRVVRFVNGVRQEIKVRLDDLLKPGDTVVVPERFF
jgi:polysaccharide biosynthesis/export protein